MAVAAAIVTVVLFACTIAQVYAPPFFDIPAMGFNRGGRVNFAGLSLGQVCKEILLLGGKEALSDGMGAAAKWFANQRIPSQVAGGTDNQMQCLYTQATGGMLGMIGPKDPGNIFGDYFDTVIEYPMIIDPCTAPRCDGKVNPSMLLMQAFAPRGGGFVGGIPNPSMAAGRNPFLSALMSGQATGVAQRTLANAGRNPFLSALMSGQATGVAQRTLANATPSRPANINTAPASSSGSATALAPPGDYNKLVSSILQNPQVLQALQQAMVQILSRNPGQTGGNPYSAPQFNPMAGFSEILPFGMLEGLPGLGGMFL